MTEITQIYRKRHDSPRRHLEQPEKLASLLLPALAKAKNKANRVKCSNNLGTISKAFNAYASDDEGQTAHLSYTFAPIWNTSDHTRRAQAMGYENWSAPQRGNRWMQAFAIRQSLIKLAVLASPCDQKATSRQRRFATKTFDQWTAVSGGSIRLGRVYQSYAIAMQGDLAASSTILALTRNVRGDGGASREAYYTAFGGTAQSDPRRNDHQHRWIFPQYRFVHWNNFGGHKAQLRFNMGNLEHGNTFYGPGNNDFSMTGLATGQGNWLLGGGGTAQGSDSEFNDALRASDKNFNEGDAVSKLPNLTVLRPYSD